MDYTNDELLVYLQEMLARAPVPTTPSPLRKMEIREVDDDTLLHDWSHGHVICIARHAAEAIVAALEAKS